MVDKRLSGGFAQCFTDRRLFLTLSSQWIEVAAGVERFANPPADSKRQGETSEEVNSHTESD